jgi:hypothetical protein
LEFCVGSIHAAVSPATAPQARMSLLGLIAYNGQIEIHPSLLNVVLHEEPHINRCHTAGANLTSSSKCFAQIQKNYDLSLGKMATK